MMRMIFNQKPFRGNVFALSPANRWSQGQYSHDRNFDGILVRSSGKIRLEVSILSTEFATRLRSVGAYYHRC